MTKKKISVTETRSAVSPPRAAGSDAEPPSPAQLQIKAYEQAVRLFGERKLAEARTLFIEVTKGPAQHIADKARSYVEVCERRSGERDVQLSTADDHFNYGVERLNARDIELAKRHLDQALSMQPDADHVLYTLALCCGYAGDGHGATENLKRAIDLEPRNRVLARQDPEFTALAAQFPAVRALLAATPSVSW